MQANRATKAGEPRHENETLATKAETPRHEAGPHPSKAEATAQSTHAEPGGARKNLDCFNFTGRQPQPVITKIGSRDPMVKKMVYNQYRDMLRKYSNTSTSP